MANLLINTTVGGNAVITTSNIGSYALTSLPSHNHDDRYFTETESDGRFQPLENQRLSTGNSPTFVDIYANEWFRNNNINEGLYNQATGTHFYSNGATSWAITGSGGNVQLEFRSNHQSTIRGFVYADTSNQIGFLNNAGDWSLRTNSSKDTQIYGALTVGSGTSADIYMTDTDETTRRIHTNSGRIGFLNSSSNWGAYCDNTGNWFSNFSMRAPIFYDSEDTTYYLDPNGTSHVVNIEAVGFVGFNGNQTRDKLRVWDSGTYTIGMKSGYDYGHLGTDEYAMSFQMNDNSGRGFWWGDTGHNDNQGAASLTTDGRMVIAKSLSIGEGEAVVSPSSVPLYVTGTTSGLDVLAVDGVNGRLFTVTDDLSDSLFSVNTIAGLPVIEAFADNTVKIGKYGSNSITISGSKIAINSDTVDANFPFYVGDRSVAGSRYSLTNKGMGFNLADNYAQLQLYGGNGSYIDFVTTSGQDSGGRIMWGSSFTISGDVYFNNPLYTYTLYDRNDTAYYLDMNGTSRLGTLNINQLSVYGNTYLGDGNGDEVHINDILRVGATDSGDAHFYFGEGGSAGSDYGSHWYWDSGYTFTWNTRNNGSDTAMFDYVTNDTTYINWRRNFHMQNREINYTAQLHFNGGTRFVNNNSNYLYFQTDSTSVGGIIVRDGNSSARGYSAYFDSAGFGLLNSTGNWGIRLNPGNVGTELFYAGDWKLNTRSGGVGVSGNLYTDQNYGHGLVGLYASTRYQGVFAMGDSYKLTADGTGTGTLYGIAWTHTNVGGQSKSGLGHQALFMDNGTTQTAIGTGIWTSGLITTTSYGTSANWNTAFGWGNHASAGYLTGITSGQVTGALGYTPYNSSNPSGYISSITSGNVTTALGYTPYNSTNPSGYISSITSGNVTTALGYTPYNATNPNGYITGISFASVSSKPTTISGYGITDALYQNRDTINVDAFNATGLYRGSTSGWSNRPTFTHNGGALLTIDTHPGEYHSQFFFDTGGDRLYFRNANGGSWGSWLIMFHTGNYTSYVPTLTGTGASGTWSINVTGSAGSISGFNNPATGATANTIVYRDSSGDIYGRYIFGSYHNSSDNVDTGSITYIMAKFGDNYHRSATAAKVQAFLGLGSLAYSSATIPTNNNQLTNGAGYITGYTETDTLQSVTSRGSTTTTSITADRFRGNNTLVLNTFTTVNPASNVFLYSQPNDRDSWIYLDSADTGSNWGIYHRQIDSAVGGMEGNSIGFIGGGASALRAYIGLSTGNGYFAGTLSASNFSGSSSGTNTGDQTNISGNAATATYATTAGSATNLSGTGGSSIQSTSTGTSYTTNYQIRENAGGSGSTNEIYAPQLAFHWGGVVASSIMMESSGRMAIRNNPGGSYENFIAAVIYSSGYGDSTQWNTAYGWGNHASAGYQAASTAITTSNIGSQSVSNATTAGGLAVHSGRNNEVNKIVRTDGSGYIQAGWINSDSGNMGFGTRIARIQCSDDNYIRFQTLTEFKVSMGLSGKNNYSRRIDYTADANYHVGSFGHAGTSTNDVWHYGSGFYDVWAGGGTFPGSMTHIHGFNAVHYSAGAGGNGYGWQMASQYDRPGEYYARNINGGTFSSWRQFITSDNIGSQSVSYATTAGTANAVAWTNVSSRPTALSQFTNDLGNYGGFLTSITAHTHAISDVTGLQTALDSKQASLGFTPYNSTNPSGYITSSGSISGNAATATTASNLAADTSTRFKILTFTGVGGDSGNGAMPDSYAIYQQGGSWTHPYPDLCIGYHTGIKIGANSSYNGTRFYNDSNWATEIFSVGNGDNHVRVLNNLYVTGTVTGSNLSGTNTGDQTNISGNAATATNVAWTGVTSRPTALSQFTNDLGNYGGWITGINSGNVTTALGFTPYNATNPSGYITSSASISGNAATATNVAWSGVTSKPAAWLNNDLLVESMEPSATAFPSGFYQSYLGAGNPTGTWFNYINVRHNNPSNGHGYQLGMSYYDTNLWFRSYQGSTSPTFSAWAYAISSLNIGSQSVSYASTAGSATSATNAGQLNTYGYLVGDSWDTYYTSGKLRVASVAGSTSTGAPPNVHNYGSLLSYGITSEDMFQMYFPDNASDSIANSRKLHYRTGRSAWCTWRTVVDMVGDTLTIVEGATPKIVIRGSAPYPLPTSASIELVGDADNNQTKSYRWISTAPDWGGQDLKLERYSINNGYQLVGRVPKNTYNLEWQGTITQGLSDSRVKANVVSMAGGLDKIDQIRPVTFDWIPTENVSDREGADFGFIAQELEEVLPEVVHTRGDGYKTVMYEKVVPVLVQAMKEQQTMIEALRAEVELLKNK